MNTLTTNIIRNVYNIGTNACDSGPSYCSDGYALYFPCLKDITKGQDVCFDFYVADYAGRNEYLLNAANTGDGTNPDGTDGTGDNGSGKELADLRDVDAISLNLIGPFNCTYGSFSYPDNISSLQTEQYPVVYRDDFGERYLCHLKLVKIDTDKDDYFKSAEEDFYSGTSVTVAAYDTPTHIFEGWAILDADDEDCPEDSLYGNIFSRENEYTFTINEDILLLAIYRPRNKYTVIVNPNNRSSHFIVDYNHISYDISNRDKEIFDDDFDMVTDVLEGYHMVAKCMPSSDTIASSEESDYDETTYEFVKWADNNESRCRLFVIGKDTAPFRYEDDSIIALLAYCSGPVPYYRIPDEYIDYRDEFDEEGIHILTDPLTVDICNYYGDNEHVIELNDVCQKFIEEIGYLYFNSGTIVLSSAGIEDGIKIILEAKADDECELTVNVNGYEAAQSISTDEFKQYEFYFSKCDKSNIEITTNGECLVDMIEVCKEEIIDKGKAQLCLPAEVTANLPSGQLSVNGAIMVNGQSYGLATTQIGTVNRLPKITLNIE